MYSNYLQVFQDTKDLTFRMELEWSKNAFDFLSLSVALKVCQIIYKNAFRIMSAISRTKKPSYGVRRLHLQRGTVKSD